MKRDTRNRSDYVAPTDLWDWHMVTLTREGMLDITFEGKIIASSTSDDQDVIDLYQARDASYKYVLHGHSCSNITTRWYSDIRTYMSLEDILRDNLDGHQIDDNIKDILAYVGVDVSVRL